MIATLVAALIVAPGLARAADSHATPSTFASMFSAAQGGDTVYLASGAYGSFSGGAKSSMVTVAAEPGATPTMSGGNFGSSVRNITIRGVTFTGPVEVSPGSTPLNLVFDGDMWGNVGHSAHEGRLSIAGGSGSAGVQVKNSTLGPGGCSDGIQVSSDGVEIGPGNEIKGIVQGGCSEHVDAIQPYGANNVYIHDNYLHDNEQGIMSPDGVSTGYRITNNVLHTSTGYPCMHLGDTRNGSVTHNVCRNGSIRVYGGNQNTPSQNMVVQDNAAGIDASACTGCTINHNQTVSYSGGSGRCAYATASPKGTASDGTDIGLNDCSGGSTPPPPPPADTTPPDTSISSAPADPTTATNASFSFAATETGSSYECKLDSASWASCTAPKTYSGLAAGTHTFNVRATDTAGNTDTTPAAWTWTINAAADTTAPETTITSGPTGTTNDNTPTFAFSASEPNPAFECRVDSGSWANCTSPWTTATLADGAHSVSVRATDVAGNTDPTPATRSFTVNTAPPPDTTPPDTMISSGPTGTTNDSTPTFAFSSSESNSAFECRVDTGSWADCTSPWTTTSLSDGDHSVAVRATDLAGNTDPTPATRAFTVATAPPPDTTPPDTTIASGPTGTTNDSTPTFAFSATEAGSTFQCQVDAGAWATCTSPWTTAALADGSHSVSVRATDAAGNTDATPATRAFTVATAPAPDTTPPDTTITSGPNGPTNDNTPTFAFTSTEAGSTFQCQVDAGAWAACTSPWTTATLADGSHSVSVKATDAAGNTDATPATRSLTVSTAAPPDTTRPDTTITAGPNGPTNDSTPTFSFSSTEAGSTFRCRVDSKPWATCASPWTTAALADGAHSASVRATDAAGNTDSSPATRSFTVDTAAPHTTITSPPAAVVVGSNASLSFNADDAAARFECKLDGGAWAACTSPRSYSDLSLGSHTAAVRATDAAGNVESPGAGAGWTNVAVPVTTPPPATNAAPTVALTAPAPASTFTWKLTMAAAASDDQRVARVEFWIDGQRVARDTSAPYAASYTATGRLAYGVHTVTARAFDAAGLASSAAVTVTRVRAGDASGTASTTSDSSHTRSGWSYATRQTVFGEAWWRMGTAPLDAGSALHGRGGAGRYVTVSLTRCGDASGTAVSVMRLRAGADGGVQATLPTDGLCVLRVQPGSN